VIDSDTGLLVFFSIWVALALIIALMPKGG
jgi:hypothetical protein